MQKWAKSYLSDSDLKIIEDAVFNSESETSGEIVPMVVRRSSSVGHVFWILNLTFLLLYQMLLLTFDWHHLLAWWVISLPVLVSVFLSYFLSQFKFIQRWCTNAADRNFQVLERAEIEFYRHHIGSTDHRTAILIFLSLMEREAVVLADVEIAKKLPQSTWDKTINILLTEISKGQTKDGLVKAISMAGQILKEHFPSQSDDKNELKNHLIIKE